MTFSDLGLGGDLLRAVEDAGYTRPTPIQEQAIPMVLQGRDVLGCAQTGTGKTASFTLPMIDVLASGRARARMPRSLILEPTRELAAQVSENFETHGKYHKLSMALLIGGESFGDQVRKLDRGVDVLIATPGRMIDLFERGSILLSDIKILVIDEADRMLDMGFIPDIERIVAMLPRMRQTLMFSATMPPEIKRLADKFLMNPKEISVAPPASPAETVTQAMAIVAEDDKRKALRHLLRTEAVRNAFIFCNRKRDVAILHKSLTKHGFNAGALHGDLPQNVRTETLELFRRGELDLLVCSDVAARGLDISGVSHVFNFDIPFNAEDYVHRIGRTGRAGKAGRAFSLAVPWDTKLVGAIEKLIGREIPRILIDGLDNGELDPADERSSGRTARGRGRGGKPADRKAKDDRPSTGRVPEGRASEGRGPDRRPREDRRDERPAAQLADTRPARNDRGEYQRADHGRPDHGRPDHGRPDHGRVEAGRGEHMRGDQGRWDNGRGDGGRGRQGQLHRQGRHGDPRDGAEPFDSAVIGFGDHVPAFILRAARPQPTNHP